MIREEYRRGIQRLPKTLYHLDVPVIAAINGPAIGAGLDLATMCDIRIASERATFAESFVKVGIVPGDGGAWLLPRAVGMSKAAEMAFTGDTLTAKEALECGLVSRVVPHNALMDEAFSLPYRVPNVLARHLDEVAAERVDGVTVGGVRSAAARGAAVARRFGCSDAQATGSARPGGRPQGSWPFNRADCTRLITTAARWPANSLPQKSHAFRSWT